MTARSLIMAEMIPTYEIFDVHADGNVFKRWENWVSRLENLFVAANITADKRKRALLLHYAGKEVYEIFQNLTDTGLANDYNTAKEKLCEYFKPKKNTEFEIFEFRKASQKQGETIDEFHIRLRSLATHCEFADKDLEIKSQIIQKCLSKRLRRKALKTPGMTLDQLLTEARGNESSDIQASGIEKDANDEVNRLCRKIEKSKLDRVKKCFNCNGEYPHEGQCPAKHRKCHKCNRFGHYAMCCKSGDQKNFKKTQKQKTKKKKSVRKLESEECESEISDSDSDFSYSINTINSEKCPVVNVRMNNHDHSVLVDTGSSVNIVNVETANKLPVKIHKCKTKVYPYNSKVTLPILGKFKTRI